MVLIGVIGTFWGLLRGITGQPLELPVVAAAVALSIAVIWTASKIHTARLFLLFISGCWVITRGGIVLLFPNFRLLGDERYFHEFVGRLVSAFAHGQISTLSNSYDFPVWLARSFPFYLPLAYIFGANDVTGARWLNVLLGVGQLVCLFFIARCLMSARAARVTCLSLLLFPYHFINVLSYDPQVAGTFFLLLAVWLFLSLNKKPGFGRGVCLGLSLLCAGIQRGGIDFLFIAVMLLLLLICRTTRRQITVCLTAIFLIWLPLRIGFDHWVASHDANLLRTHALGFMTRGWNLNTAGEYLPLYEQLDIASAQPEKQRTLEAILVTEFARQPVRSLLVLAPIKIAKFFALGYASTAEQGLTAGGYGKWASAYQTVRSIFAPLTLTLCLLGLVRCWQSPALQRRFLLPVLLMVISCGAIVLIWETSPRYSHPIQFALLILATAGLSGFSRSLQILTIRPRFVLDFASSGAAIALCWMVVSLCVVGVARSATKYQFLDPRTIGVLLDKQTILVEPLHPFSSSWEGAISLPAGTALPASLHIAFPQPRGAAWDHLSVSIWLPDPTPGQDAYRVSCRTGNVSVAIPPASSGHISRIQIPRSNTDSASLTLSIEAASAAKQSDGTLRLGIGYALAN